VISLSELRRKVIPAAIVILLLSASYISILFFSSRKQHFIIKWHYKSDYSDWFSWETLSIWPAIGDINGDSINDIVAVTDFTSNKVVIKGFNGATGKILWTYNASTVYSIRTRPGNGGVGYLGYMYIYDLDSDNRGECIVLLRGHFLIIIDDDGSLLFRKNLPESQESAFFTIIDANEDDLEDIVLYYQGTFLVYNSSNLALIRNISVEKWNCSNCFLGWCAYYVDKKPFIFFLGNNGHSFIAIDLLNVTNSWYYYNSSLLFDYVLGATSVSDDVYVFVRAISKKEQEEWLLSAISVKQRKIAWWVKNRHFFGPAVIMDINNDGTREIVFIEFDKRQTFFGAKDYTWIKAVSVLNGSTVFQEPFNEGLWAFLTPLNTLDEEYPEVILVKTTTGLWDYEAKFAVYSFKERRILYIEDLSNIFSKGLHEPGFMINIADIDGDDKNELVIWDNHGDVFVFEYEDARRGFSWPYMWHDSKRTSQTDL